MGNLQYAIIILSLTIFLIPISQADATFSAPNEIVNEKFSDDYKEQQRLLAEKIRDYYFEKYLRIHNPYNDKISDKITSEQKFDMPLRIDRYDENFQNLKNEQLDFAQKKYLEIMGGKTITGSFDDYSNKNIPVLELTEEEEKIRNAIHREDEDFKSYKIKQKIIAENTVKKLIKELWEEDPFIVAELFEDYYKNNSEKDVESVKAALDMINDGTSTAEELIENDVIDSEDLIQDNVISAKDLQLFWKTYEPKEDTKPKVEETLPVKADLNWKNIEWKKTSRASQEFQDLITQQAKLAENTRDEKITFLPQLNPYEENNKAPAPQENNQTEMIPEIIVEFGPIIERDDELFKEYKLSQIEKAELFFKNYYKMKDLDKNEITTKLVKQETIQNTDDKNDNFLTLKELETKKAKEKLLELLGGKNINN